jgi:NAD(P)-dependent dehydrogenase (short-subunit alcohol dehydrogenase family)
MLRDRTVWITGGGSGMGRASALLLAHEGARVVVSGRNRDALDAVVREGGGRVIGRSVDVTDGDAVAALGAALRAEIGPVDILVNAAGINVTNRSWCSLDAAGFDTVLRTNLTGAVHCTLAVLPAMRERRDGLVINISSWAGRYYSLLTGPAYSASKQALAALTMSLNIEEYGNGIRACVIYPGETATPIMQMRAKPPTSEELGRMLQPEDVAEAVRFVASLPPRACVNELVLTPTWNRSLIGVRKVPS